MKKIDFNNTIQMNEELFKNKMRSYGLLTIIVLASILTLSLLPNLV